MKDDNRILLYSQQIKYKKTKAEGVVGTIIPIVTQAVPLWVKELRHRNKENGNLA
jgi:hypothetical protein